MEKNHMKPGALVEMELLTQPMIHAHWHGFIELLYVINGTAEVTVSQKEYTLRQQDIIVINANTHHSYRGSDSLLMGRFMISQTKVQELLAQQIVVFWCNSAAENHEAFGELRTVLNQILNGSLNETQRGRIYRESLHYRLLHILCSSFLIPQNNLHRQEAVSDEERLQEIFAYIRSNYRQNIRLSDLAGTLYLSENYVSRYIKKKCGINFLELVSMVRLEQSMDDLIETDTPVIKIAMDNGFASVAAYNKCFRDRFDESPTEYRRRIQDERRRRELSAEKVREQQLMRERVEAFLAANPFHTDEGSSCDRRLRIDCAGETQECRWEPLRSIVNVGPLADLLKHDLQVQLLSSKERLGFLYVRFWDPFGEGSNIDIHAPAEELNFSQIDMALDFLVRNGLRPYMELGHKPRRIMREVGKAVYEEDSKRLEFDTEEEMRLFHQSFMKHLIRRYGAKEVRQWYFEVHEQEELKVSRQSWHYAPMQDEEHEKYFRRFDVIAGSFRELLPGVQVGGGGFPPQHYAEEGMRHIFALWSSGHLRPDFISITSFPYQIRQEGLMYFENRSTDADYLLHNIQLVRMAQKDGPFAGLPLHVAEYGTSLSSRNVINDSCWKAASLIRDLISCVREEKIRIGHWLFSDLYADYSDTSRLLFGGTGLISKNGIPKPAWYAFDFWNDNGSLLLAKDENALVTAEQDGSLRIIGHNMKNLTFSYYVEEESGITEDALPEMMEDREPLRLHLMFEHLVDGEYLVKRKRINAFYGNLQAEWKEMNQEKDLTGEELRHLKRAITYHLSMQGVQVKDGAMELEFPLEANEIVSVLIAPR